MSLFQMIAEARQQPAETRQLLLLPAAEIRPNPNQPRRSFDAEGILELSQSISQTGLIQPLTVRRIGDGYELIAGERRLRACRLLGMERIPCIVQQTPAEMSAIMALVENLQRRDLGYLEEALCYRQLLDRYRLTQEQLAERLGKSQPFIANKLRLLALSPAVREALSSAGLSERHARTLLRLPDEALRLDAIAEITRRALTVKETERYVAQQLERLSAPQQKSRVFRMRKDFRLFLNAVEQAAALLRQAGMTVRIEQETPDPNSLSLSIHIRSSDSAGGDHLPAVCAAAEGSPHKAEPAFRSCKTSP